MPSHVNSTCITRCSLCLWVILMGLGGCASSKGLSHDSLEKVIRQEETRFIATPAAAAVPAPPKTPALGLYLKPTGFLHREFEWTGRDRDAVLDWSKRIPLGPGGRSTGFLTLSSLRDQTLTELRATATRYGVDWILVFDGAAAVDRYNNYKAGLLYWTLIGAYLADGTHSDALCLLKATLWDVKTGARLFEEQAEAQTQTVGPAALVDDLREIERARMTALHTLLERLTDRFATLAGARR
ncbi:MAG TPA: hypothetical protein VJL88_09695 [Nitrospira sp.]|nr:hypothetical protein [Nitrospira sp.]